MVLPNMQSSFRAHVWYFPKDSCRIFLHSTLRIHPWGKNLVETDRENMNMDYQHYKTQRKSTTQFTIFIFSMLINVCPGAWKLFFSNSFFSIKPNVYAEQTELCSLILSCKVWFSKNSCRHLSHSIYLWFKGVIKSHLHIKNIFQWVHNVFRA